MAFPFDKFKFQAEMAKAMGHPDRMKILEILMEQELCVAELNEILDLNRTTLSKHISVLKNAGLVQDRKEEVKIYYRATYSHIRTVMESFNSMVRENLAKYQATSGIIPSYSDSETEPKKKSPPKKSSKKKKS